MMDGWIDGTLNSQAATVAFSAAGQSPGPAPLNSEQKTLVTQSRTV